MSSTKLNCFSPPIMVATFAVEISLAVYAFWRYKASILTKLVVIALACLATFQLSEYFVCTGYGSHAISWSRLGFVAITVLPPLGLHILHVLADKPSRSLVFSAYGSMVAFVAFFMTYHAAFIGHQCTGNYVIFQIGDRMAGVYAAYYYGWLFVAISLGIRWANQLKHAGKKQLSRLEAVRGMIIGYLVFLLPTGLANTINPETRRGIPSIMCGFAVIFALILTLYVLPRLAQHRSEHPSVV